MRNAGSDLSTAVHIGVRPDVTSAPTWLSARQAPTKAAVRTGGNITRIVSGMSASAPSSIGAPMPTVPLPAFTDAAGTTEVPPTPPVTIIGPVRGDSGEEDPAARPAPAVANAKAGMGSWDRDPASEISHVFPLVGGARARDLAASGVDTATGGGAGEVGDGGACLARNDDGTYFFTGGGTGAASARIAGDGAATDGAPAADTTAIMASAMDGRGGGGGASAAVAATAAACAPRRAIRDA